MACCYIRRDIKASFIHSYCKRSKLDGGERLGTRLAISIIACMQKHTASDQKLEAGAAWERGFTNISLSHSQHAWE